MIPLQLTIQGLYSYQETQTIDFEKLTDSQLFGIFGTVGSGKSSILEAIVFALYDRSERLNKSGDDRYYNMLNLQSRQLAIDFIFQVASPQVKKYRFTVKAQRKKKEYAQVEIKERGHYRWENEGWIPLEVTDAASIIGMTYENFMQTVIIPQGKFREFIDQKPNDRTQMLKELFRLEKFDLSHKTNHLLSAVRSQITDLTARLSEIGSVTPDAIDATRREAQELEVSLRQNSALLSKAEAACQSYDHLRKLFADKELAQEERRVLLRQQSDYQAKEKQLHEYREAETYFNEKFNTLAITASEQNKVQENYRRSLQQIEVSRQQLRTAKDAWEQAEAAYANRENMRGQCHDLEHLIRICQSRATEPELAAEEKSARQTYETLNEQLNHTKQQRKAVEAQLGSIEQAQEEQTKLREVAHWYEQKKGHETDLAEKNQQVTAQQRILQKIDESKNQLLTEHRWRENGSFTHFYQQLDTKYTALKKERHRLVSTLSRLRAQAELADRARQLTPGEACPLCGATHHPVVAHSNSLSELIGEEEQALAHLQQQEEQYDQLSQAMRQLQNDYQSTLGRLEEMQRQQQAVATKLKTHETTFAWEEYRLQKPEEIMEQAQQQDQRLSEQKTRRQRLTQLQQQLEQQEVAVAEAQHHWQQAQQAVATVRAKVENYRSLLKHLPYERYQRFTEAQLQQSLHKGQSKLQQVEEQHETTRQQYQEREKVLGILEGKSATEKTLVDNLTARATAIEHEILNLCQEKAFDSPDYVKSLIDLKLDTKAAQEEIVSYKNRLHAAERNYEKLEEETRDQHYDAIRHREAQATCTQLKQEIEQLHQAWAVAQREIKEQTEKLVKIEQLNKTLEAQRIREDNLKELSGLFRGSGFVNYASTVLLEDVCRAANVRFKQLTRNNLSLELNDKNEFIVRDYLNDGRTRLLKTLSGGQTFQAALCLALALAENIKSLNQMQQSFFFLDEGFGSLDKASLRVVFDALKSLRRENRVVGIISHVEELQQEIDVYLKIENDREQGSIVRNSWE